MIKKGKIDKVTDKQFWVTFLASAFRSIRFGIKEAHGLGQVCLKVHIEKGDELMRVMMIGMSIELLGGKGRICM